MKKEKDESPLSMLDSFASNVSGKMEYSSAADMNNAVLYGDGDGVVNLDTKVDDDDESIEPLIEPKQKETEAKPKDDDDEVEIKEDEEPVKPGKPKKDVKKTDEIDFADEPEENKDEPEELENNQVGLFFDAFSEALGWDVDDTEEKPQTIEGLIDYMKDVITENSEIEYADDRVKELDEYIKNGGKFEDYYQTAALITDLDNIDIEDEVNQRQVTRLYLKESGYTDAQIDKKIARWEDAGVLEDEAKDNLELLKELKSKLKEQTVKLQQAARIQQEKDLKKFYDDIQTSIDKLKEIRGIKIPAEDRKKLKEYTLKVGPTGKSKYLEDYEKNLTLNFLESAYFTMKGDALVKLAKQNGESSAVERLRKSLKNTKIGGSSQEIDNNSPTPIWKAASSFFRR